MQDSKFHAKSEHVESIVDLNFIISLIPIYLGPLCFICLKEFFIYYFKTRLLRDVNKWTQFLKIKCIKKHVITGTSCPNPLVFT